MLNHATSRLPDELEQLTHRIIGCALTVHSALGPGHVEAVYHKAMLIELKNNGLFYQTEHCVNIQYRGEMVHGHRVDLVVEKLVIVELKAVERLDTIHRGQLVSYLRAMDLRVGLLINFKTDHLRGSIKRVVI